MVIRTNPTLIAGQPGATASLSVLTHLSLHVDSIEPEYHTSSPPRLYVEG